MPEQHPHRRPPEVSAETVEAVGKVTEALEWVERARGRLYDFHQLMGHADQALQGAADALESAGHHESADRLRREVVGRNALEDRWTFEIVEEFDDGYYQHFRDEERRVRDALTGGRRHVFEASMKTAEQN